MAAMTPGPTAAAARNLYRGLLRLARQLPDPVQRSYVEVTARDRFRRRQHLVSQSQVTAAFADGRKEHRRLAAAVTGVAVAAERLRELAYGERGRLRHVHKLVRVWNKAGQLPHPLGDMRSKAMRQRRPGPAEHVPLPEPLVRAWFGTRFDGRDGAILRPRTLPAPPPPPRRGGLVRQVRSDGTDVWLPWREARDVHRVVMQSGHAFYRRRGRVQSHRLSVELRRRAEKITRDAHARAVARGVASVASRGVSAG